ncbi:MAG TPA: hypothetical protein VKX29_00025 [Brumimicrobium sp.]|nr:hypothetical protein [Brumimicrobium sp.]
MKLLQKLSFVGICFIFLSHQFSYSQIEKSLTGTYTITDGSLAEAIVITSDKVEVIANSEVIEKYFFYDKTEQGYILEKVSVETTSIDTSIKKDRRLLNVSLNKLADEEIQLDITHPNGIKQEISLKKLN